jgi:hypothetical protein
MTMTKPNINITQDMKQAAKNLFMAMAFTETIRPIVEGYQRKIINEMKPQVNERDSKISRLGFKTITEPKHSYLMNNTDFKIYLNRCNEERIKAGLKVKNDEYCPLLVAEDLQRQAERVFVETMEPITHLTADKVLCSKDGLANYKQLIDISLRLLAPYVDNKL